MAQPLLVAVVLSMVISPFILANNARIARLCCASSGPGCSRSDGSRMQPTGTIAQREHVILCGYGRVGQSVARVLESQGFEYIALDLDPARIRAARQAGEPVLYGDSADEDMLVSAGCRPRQRRGRELLEPGRGAGHRAHRAAAARRCARSWCARSMMPVRRRCWRQEPRRSFRRPSRWD